MPKIVNKDEKRKEIANSALEVFIENGYERASLSQIAKTCGIGKATVYEYFSSKEELIIFALRRWLEGVEIEAESMSMEIEDAREHLVMFVGFLTEVFLADSKITKFLFRLAGIMIDSDSVFRKEKIFESMIIPSKMYIESILEKGVNQKVFKGSVFTERSLIAANLLAFLDGITLHFFMTDDYIDLKEQIDSYMKYLIEGIIK